MLFENKQKHVSLSFHRESAIFFIFFQHVFEFAVLEALFPGVRFSFAPFVSILRNFVPEPSQSYVQMKFPLLTLNNIALNNEGILCQH